MTLTPPTIAVVSPTADTTPGSTGAFSAIYSAAKVTPIVLSIADTAPGGLLFVLVTALFQDGSVELVYRDNAFAPGYQENSAKTTTGSTGLRLSIRRDDNWPAATATDAPLAIGLKTYAIDTAGNLTDDLTYWQMPSPHAPSLPVDVTEPTDEAADFSSEAISLLVSQFRS